MEQKEKEERCGAVVRGCEKRIYYVKNPESEIFDEAYLILRRQERGKCASPKEIEREAMRILKSACADLPQKKRGFSPSRDSLKAFFAGCAISAALIGVLSLTLWLVL